MQYDIYKVLYAGAESWRNWGNSHMEHQKDRSRKPAAIYGGILAAAGFFMMLAAAARGDGTLTLWETGFNSLLVVLGLAAIFCPSARLTEESMPEAWVRAVSYTHLTEPRAHKCSTEEGNGSALRSYR